MKYENIEEAKIICEKIKNISILLEDLRVPTLHVKVMHNTSYCLLNILPTEEVVENYEESAGITRSFIAALIDCYERKLAKLHSDLTKL